MSSKISRWIGSALVVAWVVLFVAISSAEAQIKYSQKGFVLMDYKFGINISKADRDFSKKESIDFGTQRFRIWNYWKLGEFADAEWMWEIDSLLGVTGKFATPATNPLRGDAVKIETGIARLDVTIPGTDWHVRMGQQSFFTVLPQFQERVPGIRIYKAGGWIRPTIFFIPEEKTFTTGGRNVTQLQQNDDQIAGAWLNISPMKGLKFQPYFLWTNRKNESLGTATEFDFQRADFGFTSEYKTKGWYVNYLVVGQSGEQDFDGATKDRDIRSWATELGVGYNWGVNNFSFNFLYRRGQNARDTGDITGWSPIVTFFANKNRMSQLLTSVNQHPTHDLEIGGTTGPQNDRDAGWRVWGLWWKRPFNKQTRFELGFSVITSDKLMDNDVDATGISQAAGDDRHVGEAFDLLIVHKVTKGLTFNTGTALLIPGDGLDQPNGRGGSKDAVCCPWQIFASAILRF